MDLEAQIKDGNVGKVCCWGCCGLFSLGSLIGLIILLASITSLGPEEQVVLFNLEGKYVRNGPATILVAPGREKEWRKATRLGPREYAVVKNIRTGLIEHKEGPQLLFIGAYDVLEKTTEKVVLQKHEYMRLVDRLTGYERVVKGPTTLVPEPLEEAPNGTETAIVLGNTLAVLTVNKSTGKRTLTTTGGVFTPGPYEVILEVRTATLLGEKDFAVVKDLLTGELNKKEGPQLLQVGAYETVEEVRSKIVLEEDQYIRLLNQRTGEERVVKGPTTFVPETYEVYPDGVQKAKFLDADTAVLVLNETSGQERLVQERGVFVPNPYEEIIDTRTVIRVLPHESIVIRNEKGTVTVFSGDFDASQSSFFLPPYSEVVNMVWSDYSHPTVLGEKQNFSQKSFTKIDMRMRKMFFNYEMRTSDNVKLYIEGTIFWKIVDVPLMINATSDPEGDVWHHARSALIAAVSKSTLQQFMKGFNNITMQAFNDQAADGFYTGRGVNLESMELTRFECADKETSKILQEIIQESTNRINRLQMQKGENEVKAAELQALIKLEEQKTEYIKAQAENKRLEARMEGEAAGTSQLRAADSFIAGLNDTVPNVTSRVELYKLHEMLKSANTDTANLASGTAQLYLTPSNVNLKLAIGEAATSLSDPGDDGASTATASSSASEAGESATSAEGGSSSEKRRLAQAVESAAVTQEL